jgi:hypothetical protein
MSLVHLELPPVSNAHALTVKDERSAGGANRCSNGKLPSRATRSLSTKKSTLRTCTSSVTVAVSRMSRPASATPLVVERAKFDDSATVGAMPLLSYAR